MMNTSANASQSHSTNGTPKNALLIVLALVGCVIASYLALYQLGVVTTVWEPLFGNGSELVLHSSVARLLPVPDALLGAAGYLVEAVCATARRDAAWIDLLYHALVGILALAGVVLVALQWGYFHTWCTLCLSSALLSFVIAGVLASESRGREDE